MSTRKDGQKKSESSAGKAITVRATRALVRHIPNSYRVYHRSRGMDISLPLARAQHRRYVSALEAAGLSVSWLPAEVERPDCVFVEDTVVVWSDHALIARMDEHREGEQLAVRQALAHSHRIWEITGPARLEGGDVLHTDMVTYVGLSTRTNEAGIRILRDFLSPFDRPVVPVPVEKCLHLKSGASYLGDGTLLTVPGWFDMKLFDFDHVIYTARGEEPCANCLRAGGFLIVPDRYPRTRRTLQKFSDRVGLHLVAVDISELEKGEGSLSCMAVIY